MTAPINGPKVYSAEDAARQMGIGRTGVYEEINRGRLRSFKFGTRRLISEDAIDEWIAEREAEALTRSRTSEMAARIWIVDESVGPYSTPAGDSEGEQRIYGSTSPDAEGFEDAAPYVPAALLVEALKALRQIAKPLPTTPHSKGYRGYVHLFQEDSKKRMEIARNALRKAGVEWGQP